MGEPQLKTTAEPAGMRLVRLTIEVPAERVQQGVQQAAKQISREVNFPGFRRGKGPYEVVLQRYGEETLRRKAAEELVQKTYLEALEKEEITPYAPASLTETELEPMRFTFTVPLPPVVELGKYRSLRIKPSKIRVTKDEIDQVLERLRQENAVLEPAEGREARPGDALVVDVEGRAEDGTVFLKERGAEIVLDPEADQPVPGFHQALLGMAVGEERNFRLATPNGRPSDEVAFTVRLVRLFDRILPGINDDLARTAGNFDKLKELRKRIEEQIHQQKQVVAEEEYARRAIEAVVEMAKVEYPPQRLEEELDRLVKQFESRVQVERRMSLSDYLRAVGKTEDALREELLPGAEERLRYALVLGEVLIAEGVKIDSEEIQQRVTDLGRALGDRAEEVLERFQQEESQRSLLNDLILEKVIDRLVAIARGEAK